MRTIIYIIAIIAGITFAGVAALGADSSTSIHPAKIRLRNAFNATVKRGELVLFPDTIYMDIASDVYTGTYKVNKYNGVVHQDIPVVIYDGDNEPVTEQLRTENVQYYNGDNGQCSITLKVIQQDSDKATKNMISDKKTVKDMISDRKTINKMISNKKVIRNMNLDKKTVKNTTTDKQTTTALITSDQATTADKAITTVINSDKATTTDINSDKATTADITTDKATTTDISSDKAIAADIISDTPSGITLESIITCDRTAYKISRTMDQGYIIEKQVETDSLLRHGPSEELPKAQQNKKMFRYGNGHVNKGSRARRALDATAVEGSDERYLEMYFVVDSTLYKLLGESRDRVQQMIMDAAHQMDNVFRKINVRIVVVGIEIWTKKDRMTIPRSIRKTYEKFRKYAVKFTKNDADNAHLLTGVVFEEKLKMGRASVGGLCNPDYSSGVTRYNINKPFSYFVGTLVHEVGHNFGMRHDKANCKCPGRFPTCAMYKYVRVAPGQYWSDCSRRQMNKHFKAGKGRCIENKPELNIASKSKCGNLILDGEYGGKTDVYKMLTSMQKFERPVTLKATGRSNFCIEVGGC